MVAKKNAGDGFKRINITLDRALFDSVKERVMIEGNTVSGIIARLLTSWLNDQAPQGTTTTHPPVDTSSDFLQIIDQMKDEIEVIRNKISKLENYNKQTKNNIESMPIHTDTHQSNITSDTPLLIEDVDNSKQSKEKRHQLKSKFANEEVILVNNEMAIHMRNRLKEMRIEGMNHKTIKEMTEIPVGTQKKILSPNQTLKTISRDRYQKLMHLQPNIQ